MTGKSDNTVGHLNTILARGGGNLNDPIFKSSNARSMLKFQVDRRIVAAAGPKHRSHSTGQCTYHCAADK